MKYFFIKVTNGGYLMPVCNITTGPVASEFAKKWQSGKQNKTLTCPTLQVMFWAESSQYNIPLLSEWRGKWKCQLGRSTLGAAAPLGK